MHLLEVKDLSHGFGDKELYIKSSFDLNQNDHMGIVGQNGTGKTTLLNILMGEYRPDKGQIIWHPKIRVGYLDQYVKVDESLTIFEYLQTAYADLLKLEQELNEVYLKMSEDMTDQLLKRMSSLQEQLEKSDFYSMDTKILQIATGLGIDALNLETTLNHLSGGQRAKVIMAKLLLEQPDVLLLDEPTNFLDTNHIEWLEKYLKDFQGAFIVVSHDFDFLNGITNCILDIEFSKITKYPGNFESFLTLKGQAQEEYIKAYHAQKKMIAKTEDYIARNKARASTAKMARGRQKQLDRVDRLTPPQKKPKPHFDFPYLPFSSQIALTVEAIEVGYDYNLLPPISFILKKGEKIAIKGFNGIGKSTLLKTLMTMIPKRGGQFEFADRIRVGYYDQDLKWDFDHQTPLEYIHARYPHMQPKDIRQSLARCGLKAEHVMKPLTKLSGGEQSKVKLCDLVLTKHGLLILDEPTNHLDQEAKDVLKASLIQFEGSVIVVSHDESFYSDFVDQIIKLS